jgi:hypothetical protein
LHNGTQKKAGRWRYLFWDLWRFFKFHILLHKVQCIHLPRVYWLPLAFILPYSLCVGLSCLWLGNVCIGF